MLADRIYNDPSYTLFDAMIDMGAVTERHVHEVVAAERGQALWAGGSLGRREMLPNSDLDLFVLSDRPGPPVDVAISGLDKVDLGQLLLEDAVTLLETTLVDANRIVDGRPLDASALGENLRAAVRRINTSDRQLANLLADHAYYHDFDFPQKRTPFGPNIKYSSGSARVMLLFDFVHRYVTGEVPAQRSGIPELEDALVTIEATLHRRAPRRAIELVLLVKCAAISTFDATGDPRAKHVSRRALSLVHEISSRRMASWGLRRADDLITAYAGARREIEATVDDLIAHVLDSHPHTEAFRAVATAPIEHRAVMAARLAAETPAWRRRAPHARRMAAHQVAAMCSTRSGARRRPHAASHQRLVRRPDGRGLQSDGRRRHPAAPRDLAGRGTIQVRTSPSSLAGTPLPRQRHANWPLPATAAGRCCVSSSSPARVTRTLEDLDCAGPGEES